MSLFLTKDEVKELTDCGQRATQIDALRSMGIAFFVGASGWPKVPRSAIEGGNVPDKSHDSGMWRSNAIGV